MGMNNKLTTFGLVLCIVLITLLATANGLYVGNIRTELANEELFSEYLRRELAEEQRRIPICQEDSTLIGVGDFTSTLGISGGTWDAYICFLSVDDLE